jgi:alkanesulfonate monooxygenase SsuD/methylene tetrahydromethanopterin reductase-like flavin-dependent oxidoreductase (luciferase family)
MQFGLMTEPQLGMEYGELLEVARLAERLELAVFARSDHYAFPRREGPHATDAFATIAGLARETTDIRLCVLVSPVTFRHPAVIAKTAATIDEMSSGRLALGVGTGWMEEEHEQFGLPFPDLEERYARLEEALRYLRAAFGRDPGGFRGRHYSLADEAVRPAPGPGLRLIVGGTGPRRTPQLAGRFADEYNVIALPADDVASRVAVAREAAAAAGRAPDDLVVSVVGPVVTGTDEASYQRNLEAVAAADPWGRAPEAIADRYAQRGLPVGPGYRAREAVARLAEAGVGLFYVQHLGPFEEGLLTETFAALRG